MPSVGAVTNRLAIRYGIEATPGVVPTAPLQTLLCQSVDVGQDLAFTSIDVIRPDRQNSDNLLTDATPKGTIARYMDYGASDDLKLLALQAAAWVPVYRATGASVSSTTAYTVTSSTGVVAGHLVKGSGFTNAGNNVINKVTSTTGTTIVASGATLTTETSSATKIVTVIGFEGASGDITATSTGLASTTTDFTTLGLKLGQWIKIGGAATGNQFATAANNDLVRVTAIAANALTVDHLPTGWAVDAGTGKSIRILTGDFIRNGVADASMLIEVESTDVAGGVFYYQGYQPDTLQIDTKASSPITETFVYKGMTETQANASVSNGTPVAAVAAQAISAATSASVRFYENGSLSGKATSLNLQTMNNLRDQKAIGTLGNAGIGSGTFKATLTAELYFEAGKALPMWKRGDGKTVTKTAIIFTDPVGNVYVMTQLAAKITKRDITRGTVNADCKLQVTIDAQPDDISGGLTGAMFQIDRIPYLGA